jgi:hypothetical protein
MTDETSPADRIEGQSDAIESIPAHQIERILFELRGEQNIVLGTAAAGIAGIAGAVIWAAITVATLFQIGWLAIGIGFLVGIANRKFGKGIDKIFGIVGGAIAFLSVAAGNFLSVLGIVAANQEVPFMSMLTQFDYSRTFEVMTATFSPMDLIFYGIAIWEGYQFSFRPITEDMIHERLPEKVG